MKTTKQRAPVELRLKWLLEGMQKTRDILAFKRSDAITAQLSPECRGVVEAKMKTRARVYGEVIGYFDWYLSKNRPWNKQDKNERENEN